MSDPSLWQRLGGSGALATVVREFYDRVLRDPLLAPFFEQTDLDALRDHQNAFLSQVLGGPDTYTGRDLRDAHEGMKLTDAHFAAVAGHLRAALDAVGVGDEDAADVMAMIARTKRDILRPERAPGWRW